ncbi:hypothetical protein NUKP84_48610 [Klebsiella variicola]|nr:hypothetical protein NUKP84_48610 [Klebsiella variicola]
MIHHIYKGKRLSRFLLCQQAIKFSCGLTGRILISAKPDKLTG